MEDSPKKSLPNRIRARIVDAGYFSVDAWARHKGFIPSTVRRVIYGERNGEKSRQIAQAIYDEFGVDLPIRTRANN